MVSSAMEQKLGVFDPLLNSTLLRLHLFCNAVSVLNHEAPKIPELDF